jgi:hypothetical protein
MIKYKSAYILRGSVVLCTSMIILLPTHNRQQIMNIEKKPPFQYVGKEAFLKK